MVDRSVKPIRRLLRIRQQRAKLLQLEVTRARTAMDVQRSRIDELRQDIAAVPDSAGADCGRLAARSVWIQQTLGEISVAEQELLRLHDVMEAAETERQAAERECESLDKLLAEWEREERKEQKRREQIRLEESLLRRGGD